MGERGAGPLALTALDQLARDQPGRAIDRMGLYRFRVARRFCALWKKELQCKTGTNICISGPQSKCPGN